MKLPIPVTVLTGFLGSGKTTILKQLLNAPEMAGTAVIVNEFGAVGLDDALIEASEEETVLLPSGCVCCAVRGDLVAALKTLADKAMGGDIPPLTRVVIETTGLADPAPIAHTMMTEDDLFRLYALDGIVTTVDGEFGLGQLTDHFEPAKQVAIADVVLITKTDRADPDDIAHLTSKVAALNPAASVHAIANGQVALNALFGLSAFEPVAVRADIARWLNPDAYDRDTSCADPHCAHPDHEHEHTHNDATAHTHASSTHLHDVESFCLIFDTPLDGRKLSFALELLRSAHGDKLLRIKGIVNIEGEPDPFVIHGVQHVFYPPSTLEAWPNDDRRSKLVFITNGLGESTVRQVLQPLFERPSETTAPNYDAWTAD